MATTDFCIVHFQSVEDQDVTEATVIQPLTPRAVEYLKDHPDFKNGVLFTKGINIDVIDGMPERGFWEATFFTDSLLNHILPALQEEWDKIQKDEVEEELKFY